MSNPANPGSGQDAAVRALALRAISGRLIYGIVVILATLLAVAIAGPTVIDEVSAIVLATLAVVFAEFYSEVVGATIRNRRTPTSAEVAATAAELGTLAIAAVPPLVITVGAAVGLYDADTAVWLSVWLLVAVLFAFGFAAGRVSGYSMVRSAIGAAVLLAIGLIMVFVKYIALH